MSSTDSRPISKNKNKSLLIKFLAIHTIARCYNISHITISLNAIQILIKKPAHGDYKFDKKNPDPSTSWAPHRIFNIGNKKSVNLESFISLLENEIGIKAIKHYEQMQAGDLKNTLADTSLLQNWIGHSYETPLSEGIQKFISWYREFYKK